MNGEVAKYYLDSGLSQISKGCRLSMNESHVSYMRREVLEDLTESCPFSSVQLKCCPVVL